LENRCLLSVNTTTHVAGPNIDASNLGGYQGETTIAINPTNHLNMIAGSNNLGTGSSSGYTEAYYTQDGGNTWHAVNLGGNGDPGVAFDRSGNAYFSFIDGSLGISVRKSTDGGATWAAPVQVAAPPGNGGIQDKPAITVGPDATNTSLDRVYVGWDDNGLNDVLEVASSGDGGATWTAPVQVDGHADETYAQPAVGPNGQLYVAWDNFATAGQSHLMFSTSLNDGASFSAPVVAATSTINLFNPSHYSIPAQPSRGIAADPSLAVEQSGSNAGRIYMTYTTAITHNDTNIKLIASDDGGATWTALGSSPVQVNTDLTSNSQFFSAIGIDPTNGTVNLAWYDARNDSKNKQVDVYFQSYSSAGVPSGPNVKVTTAQSDESNPRTNNPNQYGDYMGIAASGGFAFPVWTDHRKSKTRGSEEIYVDPPLPIPGVAQAPAPAADPQESAAAFLSPTGPPAVAVGGMNRLLEVGAAAAAGPQDAAVAAGTRTGPQWVVGAAAPAIPLAPMAAQVVPGTPAAPAVPGSPDVYAAPPSPAAVSRYGGADAGRAAADSPLSPLPAPDLGLDAILPAVLPAAGDAAAGLSRSEPAVWTQACEADFAGANRLEAFVDQDLATPAAFPETASAAWYMTVAMAGLTVALNGFAEDKVEDSAARARPQWLGLAD
jgi:hypothetical protein